MDLIQLLKMDNFDIIKKCKLLRHTKQDKIEIDTIYKNGLLADYQADQSSDIFKGVQYLISFIKTEGNKAIFVGIYEITNKTTVEEIKQKRKLPNIDIKDFYIDADYFYENIETDYLKDLKDRLIIDWGNAAIQWCQNLTGKNVIEILPKGYFNSFPGFENVLITYNELKKIVDNHDANRDWHRMLSSVAGIYLIVDTKTGMQYVGSASGKEGILGRWKDYASNGHGKNKKLMELINNYPDRYKKFQYTILRTLPRTLTLNEVVAIESLYKRKLGSIAFGLNSN